MKKIFLLLSLFVLACCTSDKTGTQGGQLSVGSVEGLVYEVEEGTAVDLVDFVKVTGGNPPYLYTTALQDGFVPGLERIIPTRDNSPLQYAIYVKDSDGNQTKNPYTLTLTIKAQTPPDDGNVPAFPGAEGGGMYASGGRDGQVIYVTNLDDAYPNPPEGSLRWALEQRGPKTVMFKVSGIIELKHSLYIRDDNNHAGRGKDITIAGESAPGDGICLKDYSLQVVYADNVIIRFIRFRLGDDEGYGGDAFECRYSTNVIVDHCSMSWSVDEVATAYQNSNFTMQWCVVTEALRQSIHDKGTPHGYGGIWGGKDASFHHNLISRNDSRNPRFHAAPEAGGAQWRGYCDYRNNVVYGWGGEVTYGGEGGFFNMIGNMYKEGEKSPSRNRFLTAYYSTDDEGMEATSTYPSVYMYGNYYQTKNGPLNYINSDNYQGIVWSGKDRPGAATIPTPPAQEFPIMGLYGDEHTKTHTATAAYELVLEKAGAWPRDKVDNRAITDARNGTVTYGGTTIPEAATLAKGCIDTPSDVGGHAIYYQTTPPLDTDGDGIPDDWEEAHGLDKNDASDGGAYTLHPNYTNLEVYLHELAAALIEAKKTNNY